MRTSRQVPTPFDLKSLRHHAASRGAASSPSTNGRPLVAERDAGGRLLRAWRAMRRTPGAASASEPCGASGWHLSSGCTDGDGAAICPLCGRRVATVRGARVPRGVEVIESHGA